MSFSLRTEEGSYLYFFRQSPIPGLVHNGPISTFVVSAPSSYTLLEGFSLAFSVFQSSLKLRFVCLIPVDFNDSVAFNL